MKTSVLVTMLLSVAAVFFTGRCGLSLDHDPDISTNHVPHEYPTIQAGIDASVDGDTVMVWPGIYSGEGNRDIEYRGTSIVVISREGAECTIIDCVDVEEDPHRGFHFCQSETPDSKLIGFTIRGGSLEGDECGGGICCTGSSPTIAECIITGNVASSGGGLYCRDASPEIASCVITLNTAIMYGGGVCLEGGEGAPEISECVLSLNTATNGGGIFCEADCSVIEFFSIKENTCYNCGGGIYCQEPSLIIAESVLEGNTADDSGGGMFCASGTSPGVTRCSIIRNTAFHRGGGFHFWRECSPAIHNCIIGANSADEGGGCYLGWYCLPEIHFCTFAENLASFGGAVLCYEAMPELINSILWGNYGGQIYLSSGHVFISYSDIQGEDWYGEGNIDADPLFVGNGDYHLTAGSPCIDTGTDCGIYTDIDGQVRPFGSGFDMGADEWYSNLLPRFLFLSR